MNIVWVGDVDDALHFARRADAERMAQDGDLHDLRIVDHMWPGGFPRDPVVVYDYDAMEPQPKTSNLTFSEAMQAYVSGKIIEWGNCRYRFINGDPEVQSMKPGRVWEEDLMGVMFPSQSVEATDWRIVEEPA